MTIVPSSVLSNRSDVTISAERFGVGRTIYGVIRTAVASTVRPLLEQLIQHEVEP